MNAKGGPQAAGGGVNSPPREVGAPPVTRQDAAHRSITATPITRKPDRGQRSVSALASLGDVREAVRLGAELRWLEERRLDRLVRETPFDRRRMP